MRLAQDTVRRPLRLAKILDRELNALLANRPDRYLSNTLFGVKKRDRCRQSVERLVDGSSQVIALVFLIASKHLVGKLECSKQLAYACAPTISIAGPARGGRRFRQGSVRALLLLGHRRF